MKDQKMLTRRLRILLNNALLLTGDAATVVSYARRGNTITEIENVNLRRLACEIYMTAQAIGKSEILITENGLHVELEKNKY